MSALISGIIAAFLVSLISLIGVFTLPFKRHHIDKLLIYMVSFAAGGLMGGAFFHLLPEVIKQSQDLTSTFIYVILGFCFFFVMEKFLRWHHCHDEKCESHRHLGELSLIGDFIHNMMDGLIIISSFMINTDLGIIVTLSIVFHEIPEELGNFGVLLYAGFGRSKAILFNFLTGIASIIGVIIGFYLINLISSINYALISLAAGGFIYVASADFIPELHKENKTATSILIFIVFLLALAFMLAVKMLGIE